MTEVRAPAGPNSDAARLANQWGDEHRAFWQKNFKRYVRQFPSQYVAIKSGEVVAHSPSLDALCGVLEGRGILPRDAYIEYMGVNPASMMPR
jgi:hypothetical protein